MPCPPDLLIEPAQLTRYNVPGAFLAQFALRSFLVQVVAGGTLGQMQFAWQLVGNDSLSEPFASTAGASWETTIDPVFADLTFAAGSYQVGQSYTVDAAGAVTPSNDGMPALTVERFDLRQTACSAVTSEALMRMSDSVTAPLKEWGDDTRTHAASWVYGVLLRGRGAMPEGAGTAEPDVFVGESVAKKYFDLIGEKGKPDNMVDSSDDSVGPMIQAYPVSDRARGW